MAEKVGKIVLEFDVTGLEGVTGIEKSLDRLKKAMTGITDKKGLPATLSKLIVQKPKTIKAFREKLNALKKLRNEVDVNSRSFKNLGKSIDITKKRMQSFQNVSKKGAFSGIGVGGKAAAGAAIGGAASRFLPAGATTGAFAAIAAGAAGPAGIATGALIGLTVDAAAAFVQAGKSAAEYSASIKRLEVALRGVTKTQSEFVKAQEVIRSVSKELNVPIADATKQFTTLSASVIGAGGTVDDAEKVFRGVSEAIKATGGDAEDVKSAIRAMSQIFGKGKVSAEELQGQLGERLPGAVVKFANATNRTLPQLQKDLRDGVVGLNSVMKFVVQLSDDHRDAALEMASSSADAGARMKVTFDELKKNVGDILQPIGAEIQDMTEIAIKSLNDFIKGIKEFMKIGEGFELEMKERRIKQLESLLSEGPTAKTFALGLISPSLGAIYEFNRKNIKDEDRDRFTKELNQLKADVKEGRKIQKEYESFITDMNLIQEKGISPFNLDIPKLDLDSFPNIFATDQEDGTNFASPLEQAAAEDTKKARDILDKYRKSVKEVNQDIAKSFVSTFKKIEDSLVDFITTGTINFRKFAQDVIKEITRIFIRASIIKPLTSSLNNLFQPKPKPSKPSFLTDFSGITSPLFNNNLLDRNPVNAFNINQFPETPTIRKSTFGDKFGAFSNRFFDFFDKRFADGGVIPKNKIVPTRYAKGGLIERPTLFPLSNGAALAGEAGVEAIMPLRRGKDGRLGVETSAGVGNVTVNVDASGSSAEGDEQISTELGKVLGAAIQAELVNQKRPGGLLA